MALTWDCECLTWDCEMNFLALHFMKSLVASVNVAWVSSGNSVNSHSVETRPFMLKPLRFAILIKPRAVESFEAALGSTSSFTKRLGCFPDAVGYFAVVRIGPR